jgi:hypothetical protein
LMSERFPANSNWIPIDLNPMDNMLSMMVKILTR